MAAAGVPSADAGGGGGGGTAVSRRHGAAGPQRKRVSAKSTVRRRARGARPGLAWERGYHTEKRRLLSAPGLPPGPPGMGRTCATVATMIAHATPPGYPSTCP